MVWDVAFTCKQVVQGLGVWVITKVYQVNKHLQPDGQPSILLPLTLNCVRDQDLRRRRMYCAPASMVVCSSRRRMVTSAIIWRRRAGSSGNGYRLAPYASQIYGAPRLTHVNICNGLVAVNHRILHTKKARSLQSHDVR